MDGLKALGNKAQATLLELQKNKVEQMQQRAKVQAERGEGVDEQTKKAASDFEALLLSQMFKAMWKNVSSENSMFASSEEETYRDMLHDALAQDIAEKSSVGIKDVIIQEFEKNVK